jgi:hypothetical protein
MRGGPVAHPGAVVADGGLPHGRAAGLLQRAVVIQVRNVAVGHVLAQDHHADAQQHLETAGGRGGRRAGWAEEGRRSSWHTEVRRQQARQRAGWELAK